jgi:hypothetical protein
MATATRGQAVSSINTLPGLRSCAAAARSEALDVLDRRAKRIQITAQADHRLGVLNGEPRPETNPGLPTRTLPPAA